MRYWYSTFGIGNLSSDQKGSHMSALCKNCGASLIFNPATQKVSCRSCGSAWEPEELEGSDTGSTSADADTPMPTDRNRARQKVYDCYVYTCKNCGGSILVTGSETSTTCAYCGSANVILSRFTKEKSPDYILPFQFSKETAIRKIKEISEMRILVPDAFQNLDPESVHGIYVPYWLVNVHHAEAGVFQGEEGDGEDTRVYYYGRSASMKFTDLQIEASEALDDVCTERLDVFDTTKMKPFHENYLLGFYSDRSDIHFVNMRRAIRKKTLPLFTSYCLPTIRAMNKRLYKEEHETIIDKDIRYVLFPVWFVTVKYQNVDYTILVNGESGKVASVIPADQATFRKWVFGGGLAIGFLSAVLALIIRDYSGMSASGSELTSLITLSIIVTLILSTVFILLGKVLSHSIDKLNSVTQNPRAYKFIKKREG